jgi:hypothetical protein
MPRIQRMGRIQRIRRMFATSLLVASALAGALGSSTNAEAAPILITPTDHDLPLFSLPTNFAENAGGPGDLAIAPVFIQALLTADEDFGRFLLRNVTVLAGVYKIGTVDFSVEDLYPTLETAYEMVPEPGSLLLVGTALILGARRLRRTVEVQ